jgi:hypothetical protein
MAELAMWFPQDRITRKRREKSEAPEPAVYSTNTVLYTAVNLTH